MVLAILVLLTVVLGLLWRLAASHALPQSGIAGTLADAKATLAYWDAVVAAPKNGCGLSDALKGIPDPLPQQGAEIYRQMAAHADERRSEIASLPMLDVDPIATEYAISRTKTIGEIAELLTDLASFNDEVATATSDDHAWANVLFMLMRHANDGDGWFANAAKEGASEFAAFAESVQSRGNALAKKMAAVQHDMSLVEQREIEARARLTQAYSLEFKPTPAKQPLAVVPTPPQQRVDAAMLQGHLVGQKVKLRNTIWTFERGEFLTFQVVKAEDIGDTTRYQITTHIRGIHSGNEHVLTLYMLYHREQAGTVLRAVSAIAK